MSIYKIIEGIYLSAESGAKSEKVLKEHKISHILNCARTSNTKNDSCIYKHCKMDDSVLFPVNESFDECEEFIDEVIVKKNGTGVVVHCVAGISRSACIVISYLMKKEGLVNENRRMTLREAYEFVEKKRECKLAVNFGFFRYLCALEEEVNESKSSVDYREWLISKIHSDLNIMIPNSVSLETVKEELSTVQESFFEINDGVVHIPSFLKEVETKVTILQEIAMRKIGKSNLFNEMDDDDD